VAEQGQRRKLAAILSADVVGYSRLMQDDDAATVETLTRYRAIFSDFVKRHEGRIVDSPGDNILAQFDSPVEAVQCAVEIQRELARRNLQLAQHRQMQFRIGINLGDILSRDDGTIYGDGVNVAARLESLAEPGGIMISESARMQVRTLIDVGIADAGEHEVKNIKEPVHAYRIVLDETTPRARVSRIVPRAKTAALAAAALVIAIVVGMALRSGGETEDPILAMPTGPTIAVLPFTNMSGDPEQEYFSDGITEDIITELSRFDELHVISRLSTFQYKGKAVDVRQVGRELGAHYVVEGSVRKAGNRMRVTAQLLDAKDGKHLWAESYDRNLTAVDIFAVQDEVTGHIVTTIADAYGIIRVTQMTSVTRKHTQDLGGYECVLRAHEYYRAKLNPSNHFEVRNCLEEAVATDPGYADAWTWLAGAYRDEYEFSFNTRPNSLERAETAAKKAIALEPLNQAAHAFLADVMFDRHDADSYFEQAEHSVAINPNSANVLVWQGHRIAFAGKWERGIALVRKGFALSRNPPGWMYWPTTVYYYNKGEYEQALVEALNMKLPGFFVNHYLLAATYAQLGRKQEAHAAVDDLLGVFPNFGVDGRTHLRGWYWEAELEERLVDGLRKAGLNIPDEPSTAD
jgi:adenylate cyclase